MAYIGKEPIVGNFQVCDAISVVNGQAAYTMQVSSTNVTPESANHMLVSLNGILQKPNSSFTVSGSTITFANNLQTGDSIDFIMLLGSVLNLAVPSDATVTDAKTNFVSTSSGAGLQIKGDGTTDGTLQLNCSQNSHGIKLASPNHAAGQSYTLTFPATAPQADKALITDGSGNLSFGDAGGGKVLQVKQSVVTNRQSGSGGFNDITGLSVSITPSATSSKILVMGSLTAGSGNQYTFARFMRDTTAIGIADANSSNQRASFGNFYNGDDNDWATYAQTFLDSPSTTSATTYKIQVTAGGSTYYINYGGAGSTISSRGNGISTITVMEIGS